MKATIALELEHSLKRLRRHRRQTYQAVRRLGRHAKAAAKVRSGEDLQASQLSLMWAGYTVLERLTPADVLEKIASTPLHRSIHDPQSYHNPRAPKTPSPAPPEQLDSSLALISWLRSWPGLSSKVTSSPNK